MARFSPVFLPGADPHPVPPAIWSAVPMSTWILIFESVTTGFVTLLSKPYRCLSVVPEGLRHLTSYLGPMVRMQGLSCLHRVEVLPGVRHPYSITN